MDVYGLQILDATLAGNAVEEDTAASALLLKHEFLDGGADDVTLATLGEVLLEPTLTTLGNFLVRSNSQLRGGRLQLEGYGGSIPGLVQQSAGTLDLYSMQIRASAFEGESVSVTDLLADSLALTGSATLDGLTAQGNVGCDQLLCNDVNCTDVFTTGGRVKQLAEHQRRGQRGPAELRHRNHGQHTHHQQHGQRRELHHDGRRVHGHADGLGRSNRGGRSQAPR